MLQHIISAHSALDLMDFFVLLQIHFAASPRDMNNLVKYDRKTRYFQITGLARISGYYYISHRTIPTMSAWSIQLGILRCADCFLWVIIWACWCKLDEKMKLAKLLDCVLIPVKGSLEDPSAKINVLPQAFFSCRLHFIILIWYTSRFKLEGLSLSSDMVYIR